MPAQNDSERIFIRKIADNIRISEERGITVFTSFLDEREIYLAKSELAHSGCDNYSLSGGYDGALRQMLCINPSNDFIDWQFCCVKVTVPYAKKLTHRDYLGSAMGLGIKRECLGDIVVTSDESAYIFVQNKISRAFISDFINVARYSASCEEVSDFTLDELVQNREVQRASVPSLRLDAVLSTMIKSSRGNAASLINSGAVTVNHVEVTQTHYTVYENDNITARGHGKFNLCEIKGKSKKDRIIIEYYKY